MLVCVHGLEVCVCMSDVTLSAHRTNHVRITSYVVNVEVHTECCVCVYVCDVTLSAHNANHVRITSYMVASAHRALCLCVCVFENLRE